MGPAATPAVTDMDFREELENLQGRMSSVLVQLQEVHAKISATAESADRLFAELRGENATSSLLDPHATDSPTVR
jgi:hypothetical protein